MPETESSHTASRDASKDEVGVSAPQREGSARWGPPLDELGELAREWAASRSGDADLTASRSYVDLLRVYRVRLVLTFAFALVAAFAMVLTHRDFGFALSSATPAPIGDVRAKWLSHERALPIADNTFVRAENLMPTRAHTLKFLEDPSGEADAWNVYFCPLSNILVITEASVPPPEPAATLPPAFEGLIPSGRATRGEVPLAVSAAGRLFYGYDAPTEFLPIVGTFARLTGTAPSSMWLLLDGVTPSQSRWTLGVWVFAFLSVLTSLVFLIRAYRALRVFRRSARDEA